MSGDREGCSTGVVGGAGSGKATAEIEDVKTTRRGGGGGGSSNGGRKRSRPTSDSSSTGGRSGKWNDGL